MQKTIYRTAVVTMPCAGSSTVYSMLDVMASVGRDWEVLHGNQPHSSVFDAALVSVDGKPYKDINRRLITPDSAIADFGFPEVIIVPDLHIDPNGSVPMEFEQIIPWLIESYANGAIITSVCSGALLLASANLLNGLDATCHWGFCDLMSRNFPEIKMRRERILVPAGEGHRIVTAGGASSWGDLMLYLIGRLAGQDEARRLAKIYLLQPHTDGQLHYASLIAGSQSEDRLVADAQVWAADNYAHPAPVAAMAKISGLTERSLLRRFRKATGQSPLDYIQTLKIEEAKQMLETTNESIEAIAAEIGYLETSSFRNAFRRHVGMPASAYRKKRLSFPSSISA